MIGFGEAVRHGLAQYLDPRGRASRAEYWWWWLFVSVVQFVTVDTVFAGLLLLGLLAPSFTVLVRRLHDTGRAGWWMLVALIPAVGVFVLLFLLVQRGEDGPNRYGAPRLPSTVVRSGWEDVPPAPGGIV